MCFLKLYKFVVSLYIYFHNGIWKKLCSGCFLYILYINISLPLHLHMYKVYIMKTSVDPVNMYIPVHILSQVYEKLFQQSIPVFFYQWSSTRFFYPHHGLFLSIDTILIIDSTIVCFILVIPSSLHFVVSRSNVSYYLYMHTYAFL